MSEAVIEGLVFGAVLAVWMGSLHILLTWVAGPPK